MPESTGRGNVSRQRSEKMQALLDRIAPVDEHTPQSKVVSRRNPSVDRLLEGLYDIEDGPAVDSDTHEEGRTRAA